MSSKENSKGRMSRKRSTFDEVLFHVNEFGLYQKRLYLLVILPVIFDSFTTMTSVFYLSDHPHRCASGDVNETYLPYGNVRTIEIPSGDMNVTYIYSECTITRFISSKVDMDVPNVTEEACSSWVYDNTYYEETVISDMDLVCDKQSFRSHGKMIFFSGYLIGGFLAGALADIFGRRPVLSLCLVIMFVSNMVNVWAEDFIVFIICRFFYGVSVMGYFNTSMVIGLELVGPAKRKWTGFGIYFLWCVGEFLLCGVAYFFREWRQIQLAAAIPSGLFVFYYWMVPESPRWLLSRGRHEEAKAILKKAAKVNKTTIDDKILKALVIEQGTKTTTTEAVISLLKSPKMLVTTFVLGINWFVGYGGYHGLSLNVGHLAGNVYLNFLISVTVELLAYTITILLFDRIGRRIFHCTNLIIGGLACLAAILPTRVFPEAPFWIAVALTMTGKLAMSGVFAQIYVFSSELYPTTLRTFAVGVLTVLGTSGSIIAPYVSDIASYVDTEFGKTLPVIIFGSSMIVAVVLAIFLPETFRTSLPETIIEAESFRRKSVISLRGRRDSLTVQKEKV